MGNEASSAMQPDKFVLIYEVNNNTPLFSYAASKKLDSGNYTEAIKILEKGIAKFPHYPTPFFLYAKALAFLGKGQEASDVLQKAARLFDESETYQYYEKLISEILSRKNTASDNPNVQKLADQEKSENADKPVQATQSEFEDNLEVLAKELEDAKIIAADVPQEVIEKHKKLNEANNKIITETLAGIYLDQNVWDKALEIYRELVKIRPEKAGFYRQKIERIEEIIAKRKKD